MKKLFIFSGSFFLLVLVFLGVYNFAFRNNVSNPIADPMKKAASEKEKGASEAAAEPRSVAFQQIIGESVFQPVAGENSLFYYSKRDSALKEATLDGKEVTVRVPRIPGVPTRIIWSPNRLQALLQIKADGGDLWHLADLRNQTVVPFKKEMSRMAWTSLGDRILYQFTDPGTRERSLNIASPDGSNWRKIADLGQKDHFIASVPRSSLVAFWTKTDGREESALETITINGDGRQTILSPRFGADFLWSPDSRRLLVQSVTEKGGNTLTLGLTDESGAGYHNLFAPTLALKAAWSKDSDTFYYALPNAFPAEAVMPNDYFGQPITTTDTLWKMNVRTGKKERLVPLEEMKEAFDVTDIFLAPTETDLFFVDRTSGRLYRITL